MRTGHYQEGETGKYYFVATWQITWLDLHFKYMRECTWSHGLQVQGTLSWLSFPFKQWYKQIFHAGRQAGKSIDRQTGVSPNSLNLPIPRIVLLVLRGLTLAWVDEPVLPVVFAVFLAPEAPSRCLAVAAVPPAGLEEAGRVALCCFLAWASRGRTWFPRARGLVSHLSEQISGSRKGK